MIDRLRRWLRIGEDDGGTDDQIARVEGEIAAHKASAAALRKTVLLRPGPDDGRWPTLLDNPLLPRRDREEWSNPT